MILRGPAAVIEAWRRELAAVYAPRRLVLAVPGATGATAGRGAARRVADKPALPGGAPTSAAAAAARRR